MSVGTMIKKKLERANIYRISKYIDGISVRTGSNLITIL